MGIAEKFKAAIDQAERALSAVTETEAGQSPRIGGWVRKEELGHLLDSAQNNHQRIVTTAINGTYSGPEYAQNEWVDIHGYQEMAWADLLAFWKARNEMLQRVITRIPEERLVAPMNIGDNPAMSLGEWIEDYLHHMAHHIEQITARP